MTAQPTPAEHHLRPDESGTDDEGATSADSGRAIQLHQHRARPEWGLALRIRQRDGRHDFQFQDGQMRTIAADFLHLLVPVDRPADETSAALRELTAMSGIALARSQRDRESETRAITLDEQVAWFVEQYADGFDDDQWVRKVRGVGQKRRAKAHREAAIAEARELLSEEELSRLLAELRGDEIWARARRVLEGTSLISNAQLRPLDELNPERHGPFGKALRDLLYGDQDFELRFTKLMQVFCATPTPLSWAAATAWLDKQQLLEVPNRPVGRIYLRLRDMALALQDELQSRGFQLRDLLDVYDFIWCTLRPAALKAIAARPPAPRASQVRLVDEAKEAKGEAASA